MAENHLDYDYLEDEAIDEHFAEDPVGIDMSCVCSERNRLPLRVFLLFVWVFLFVAGFCARQRGALMTMVTARTSTSIA